MVLYFWQQMTITLALQAVLTGLLLSVTVYLFTIREIRWRTFSWGMVKELIGIGVLPAVFSAVVIVTSSFYVLAANWSDLGRTIGLVVFGNNVSTMILFGLNAVSWAITSRSMKRLYAPPGTSSASTQEGMADLFFRFGVIGAALLALMSPLAFTLAMKAYSESTVFILYFCLFHSYGILLISELNFLNANSRLRPVIFSYIFMIFLLGAFCLFTRDRFLLLMQIGIGTHFCLSLHIVIYCKRMGFNNGAFSHRVAALVFPVACMLLYSSGGTLGALGVCFIFLIAGSIYYGKRLRRAAALFNFP